MRTSTIGSEDCVSGMLLGSTASVRGEAHYPLFDNLQRSEGLSQRQ